MKKFMLSVFMVFSFSMSTSVQAEDFDLDSSKEGEKNKRKKRERSVEIDRDVREITRGWYAKSNVGGGFYLGQLGATIQPGTIIALSGGQDFLDREKMSMAWEVSFAQGVHNGTYYEDQAAAGGPYIQGDLRTYFFTANVEYSRYPTRRIGIGARGGGGVMMSPLLMDEEYYQSEVVSRAWGGLDTNYHKEPHPVGMGGLTFEYYTKLAHFSVGLDADFIYAIGFDMGAMTTVYLKYTF